MDVIYYVVMNCEYDIITITVDKDFAYSVKDMYDGAVCITVNDYSHTHNLKDATAYVVTSTPKGDYKIRREMFGYDFEECANNEIHKHLNDCFSVYFFFSGTEEDALVYGIKLIENHVEELMRSSEK